MAEGLKERGDVWPGENCSSKVFQTVKEKRHRSLEEVNAYKSKKRNSRRIN